MDVTSYLLGKNAGGGSTPTLQEKEITITENGTTNVTADEGYDGLSEVEVTTNVPTQTSDYLATSITTLPGSSAKVPTSLIKRVPTFTLPATATSLSDGFSNCRELLSVELFDTSRITMMSSMFYGCSKLKSVPLFNTSNVVNMNSMFMSCNLLESCPQFDTAKSGSFANMFNGCGSLQNVPVLDFSNVTSTGGLTNMFANCANLTDASLDNILVSCAGATKYTGTKTLNQIGFTNMSSYYPASKIQSLPHYQDFINAGWTIGY